MTDSKLKRCNWPGDHELSIKYHDLEWGVVCHDEAKLFEMITLEGAQAGLIWQTILNKREGYRRLFHNFDIQRVAGFDKATVELLMKDASIVRHRGKIESTISNARRIMALWDEGSSLDAVVWEAVDGKPIINRWDSLADVPASTPQSKSLSKHLKKLGFRFVGETTCYAFMQAAGLVNDHETACFRYTECNAAG